MLLASRLNFSPSHMKRARGIKGLYRAKALEPLTSGNGIDQTPSPGTVASSSPYGGLVTMSNNAYTGYTATLQNLQAVYPYNGSVATAGYQQAYVTGTTAAGTVGGPFPATWSGWVTAPNTNAVLGQAGSFPGAYILPAEPIYTMNPPSREDFTEDEINRALEIIDELEVRYA